MRQLNEIMDRQNNSMPICTIPKSKNGKITSIEIAEITQKPHNDVLKAIRVMEPAWVKVGGGNFSQTYYIDQWNRQQPMIELSKSECLYVATKFNDEARAKLVLRWEELETENRNNTINLPNNYLDALKQLVASEEEKQLLAEQNKLQSQQLEQAAPKVEYYEKALKSESVYNTTQIAKEFGWGAVTMNKKLQKLGIQYLCNGQWVLYSRYQNKGYTKTNSYPYGYHEDGTIRTRALTVWTEKGRKFLHDLFD